MSGIERAHSKLSASGSERWLNCAASVALEEKSPPSVDNFWSAEGTLAHACLEAELLRLPWPESFDVSDEMRMNVMKTATKVRALHKVVGGKIFIEQRVFARFLHEEMFGTLDVFIVGNDRTLYVLDFKYGAGKIVRVEENTQLLQYALSIAESYNWDFDFVKMYILQPRAGSNWYPSWRITIEELRDKWAPIFKKGVERVMKNKSKPMPGAWCHWCRAKKICPAKEESRAKQVQDFMTPNTERIETNGKKEKAKSKSWQEQEIENEVEGLAQDEAESFGFDSHG